MLAYRWGQTAYESDAALQLEKTGLEKIGFQVLQNTQPDIPSHTDVLIVTSKQTVDQHLLDKLPQLKVILTTTSGHEHINVKQAHERDILVGRCPIARRDAVVDTSIAMGLSLVRNIPALHNRARSGIWARGELPNRQLIRRKDLNVGLIGYGIIGRAAMRAWSDLGAKVRWHDPALLGSIPLEELLAQSDLCSLHCAHTPSSHNIINKESLKHIKKNAILINTARGKCIDIEALFTAPQIGGIGLDVFPTEPPAMLNIYAQKENCILLPHAAGYHNLLGQELAQEVVDALSLWKERQTLPHVVD